MSDIYKLLLLLLIILIILLCKNNKIKEYLTNIDNDINNDIFKIDKNQCSKSCCKHVQWKLPKELENTENNDIIPSNFSCNFGEGSGCVCLNKNQYNFMENRGFLNK